MTYYLIFSLCLFETIEVILDKFEWIFIWVRKGHKAAETTSNVNAFGPGTANKRTVEWWFKKFAEETRALTTRSMVAGRGKLIMTSWEDYQSWSSYNHTRSCQRTQFRPFWNQHLKQIGKVKKLDKWVSDELTENRINHHFEVLFSLIPHSNNEPFLDQIVTCDEKWIFLWQLTTTSPVVGPRISKALPKTKLEPPKKDHGHCLVVCCPLNPL